MILCQTDYEEGLMKEGYAPQVRWSSYDRKEKGGKGGVGKEPDWRRACNHIAESTIASCLTPAPHMYINQASLSWRTHTAVQSSHRDTSMAGKGSWSLTQISSLKKSFVHFFVYDLRLLPQTNLWTTADPSFLKINLLKGNPVSSFLTRTDTWLKSTTTCTWVYNTVRYCHCQSICFCKLFTVW